MGGVRVWATLTIIALASAAQASEPPDLKISGRLRGFLFGADQDHAAAERLRSVNAFLNAALYADTKTIFDNGIELRTVAEANSYARDLFDKDARALIRAERLYADVNTALGRLRLGKREGVNTAVIDDPAPRAFLTVNEEIIGDALKPRTGIAGRDAATFKRLADQSFSASYETPALLPGAKLAVSFHPSTGTDRRTIGRARSAKNAWDLSGRYEGRYTGGTYRIAAGVFRSETRLTGAPGAKAWNASVAATYGGWQAALTHLSTHPRIGPDESAWTAGLLYGIGPIKVSADYTWARRDLSPGARSEERVESASLQANYRIRPDLSIGAAAFYGRQRDSSGRVWDGAGLLSGAKLSF
jgi:hypothetical protein